jgi:hypothetical protein
MTDIADAVVAFVNDDARGFTTAVVAERLRVARRKLEDLTTLAVEVIPGQTREEIVARPSVARERYEVQVLIRQRPEAGKDDTSLEALAVTLETLTDQMRDALRGQQLTAGAVVAHVMEIEVAPASVARMQGERLIVTALIVQLEVVR